METVTRYRRRVDSSFLEEAKKRSGEESESLLPVSEMHGRLSHGALYGYPAQQYHPDDPDGDEERSSGKQCDLALRFL